MDETVTSDPQPIEKEEIPEFRIVNNEVLSDTAEQKARKDKLYKGMILGNAYHRKVKIIFHTEAGEKMVETTIWAATRQNILLKGGVALPVSCISGVRIY